MDGPDASHGVPELLNRFIAVQLRGSDSVKAKARLKRIAFTLLLGLDKDEEVLDGADDPKHQRMALAGAILNKHRTGWTQEAQRLEALSEQLQRISPVSYLASEGIVHSDAPSLDHAEIMQILLSLQGSVDKGRQWRSEGAGGTLMEQLQTMHQPLGTSEQSEAHSWPKQAAPGEGSSVMQLMSTMARKPHWQKGKLGQPLPSAAKDTLLSGADLLRTMESQPETSKPMWEADSSEDSSDSGSEQDYSSGSPEAYAAPCMTIGAGTYGSGYSSTQGSLQCAARLKAHSGVGAGHAVWGRPLEGGSKTDEGDLARAALLAMQGVVPATVFLGRDDLETHELGHASLLKFVSPIVKAGKLRAILDAFLADLAAYAGSPETSAGPCLQGFAAVAQHMLRAQTAALQSVPSAVRARRLDELLYSDSKLTAGALQQDQAYLNIISSPDDVTILEVSMHTRGLQAELAVLGSLCGFTAQDSEALPEWTADGLQLLEDLHRQLIAAEARSAPLLQRLFQGAYQPFGEALADWLFHGGAMLHPTSPFAAELPSNLQDLLPERCQTEACTIALPGFLQPWKRQILVAGLQLRLLRGLPAPWCQLAADLSSAATAEAAALREATGPCQAVNLWSEADALSNVSLTFDSLSLAKVAAIQEQGLLARDSIVSETLRMLAPTPSPQQSRATHAQHRASEQDVPAEHAAEHVEALQAVSMVSSEQSMPKQANDSPPQQTDRDSRSQDVAELGSNRAAQPGREGRWSWAKPVLRPSSMVPKHPLALGSPVPPETEMSRQPVVHAAAMPSRINSSPKPNESPGTVSMQHSHTAAVQPWDKGRERSSSWQDYRSSPAADAFDCGPEAAEDAPLPAALEALVLRRVHAQFACSSRACLGCLEALQLPATLLAIQRYFFMGAGDWADALVSAFCSAGPSLEPHSLHACHSMLGAALQASAVAEDPFGSLLRLRSSMPSCRGGALPRRGCSLQLQLELSWPLTAFLPLAVMQECNMVFEELLGLRSMCWRLARTWLDCCHHPGAHGSGTEALAERRLRMLRAFRAAAAQLLDALLRHMLQGLHGPSSPTALLDLQGSGDVLAARDMISAWSNAAMQACLLHRDCQAEAQLLRPVLGAIRACLDAVVVCMTACDDNMRDAVLSFHVWEGLQRAILEFEGEMHALARRMKDDTHSKLRHLLLPMLVNDYWTQQPQ